MANDSTIDGRVSNGETINLNVTRRDFTRFISGSSLATGLTSLLTSVSGKEPDGVPLTQVYDREGKPARVRVIPETRYKKLCHI